MTLSDRITSRKSGLRFAAVLIFLITFGVLTGLLYLFIPFFSDDQGYLGYLHTSEGFGNTVWGYRVLHAWGHHYIYVNGRFANLIAIFITGWPRPLVAMLMGAVSALWLWGILRISGVWSMRRGVTAAAVLTGICYFAFAWWDVAIVDCALNYVWTAAFSLLFWILLVHKGSYRPFTLFWVLLFSFIAGGMHVGATTPFAAALFLSRFWMKYRATRQQKLIYWTYAVSAIICFLSPGNWIRAAAPGPADDPVFMLLLKSEPITLLATLLFLTLLIIPRTRSGVCGFLRDKGGVWMLAAIFSTLFVAVGGKVGRAGWFADTCSLLALILWLGGFDIRVARIPGVCLSVLIYIAMTLSGVAIAVESYRAAQPDMALRAEMKEVKKPIYYHTLANYGDLPWWTLGRVRFMKAYDEYTRSELMRYYGLLSIPKVLPSEADGMDFSLRHRTDFSDGSYVTDSMPADAVPPSGPEWIEHDTWTFQENGERYYAVEFMQDGHRYWHVSRWVPEPGER